MNSFSGLLGRTILRIQSTGSLGTDGSGPSTFILTLDDGSRLVFMTHEVNHIADKGTTTWMSAETMAVWDSTKDQ